MAGVGAGRRGVRPTEDTLAANPAAATLGPIACTVVTPTGDGQAFRLELTSAQLAALTEGVGAYVMGRRMFGGGEGPWDEAWRGWWGDDPPFHAPVFVLTHHPRAPLTMLGGTTFTFVTDGIESALEQARAAAGEGDVAIAGGASAARQYLAAGLLDELYLHIVPILLHAGERLLEDVGAPTFEPVQVVASPVVTHVRYRVVRD